MKQLAFEKGGFHRRGAGNPATSETVKTTPINFGPHGSTRGVLAPVSTGGPAGFSF